jgi:hypothetical protein
MADRVMFFEGLRAPRFFAARRSGKGFISFQ